MADRSGSLKDAVYHAVLNDIVNDVYKPNDILTESALISKYQHSKSPVREALVELCRDNVLRSIPRCGYEVIRLDQGDIEELMRVRYLLEGGYLKLNFYKYTDSQIAHLESLYHAFAEDTADPFRSWDNNMQFHMALIQGAVRTQVVQYLEQIYRKLKVAFAQFYWKQYHLNMPASTHHDTPRHQAILDGVRRKDLNATLTALKNDMSYLGNVYIELPDFFDLDHPATQPV